MKGLEVQLQVGTYPYQQINETIGGFTSMSNNTFRTKVKENDPEVIKAICNALNALGDPKNSRRLGFIVINDEKLVISVRKNKNSVPVFEVAFKASSMPESNVSAINALFKKCILSFGYDKSHSELVISIVDKYTYTPKAIQTDPIASSDTTLSCTLSLRKSIPMLEQVVEVFNVVKINKFLTMSRDYFTISAIGGNIALILKLDALESHTNRVPFFFTKFNYLSAEKLADYHFSLVKLDANTPELFQISVFVPEDKSMRKRFEDTLKWIDSISVFYKQ